MRITVGSIIEVLTKLGYVYMQRVHKSKQYGSIVRVLDGFYKERPNEKEFDELVRKPHLYYVITTLPWHEILHPYEIIGKYSIPDFAKTFPTFKGGDYDSDTGKYCNWYLWDGDKEWRPENGKLTKEEAGYPMLLIYSYKSIIGRLERGWKPEDEVHPDDYIPNGPQKCGSLSCVSQ